MELEIVVYHPTHGRDAIGFCFLPDHHNRAEPIMFHEGYSWQEFGSLANIQSGEMRVKKLHLSGLIFKKEIIDSAQSMIIPAPPPSGPPPKRGSYSAYDLRKQSRTEVVAAHAALSSTPKQSAVQRFMLHAGEGTAPTAQGGWCRGSAVRQYPAVASSTGVSSRRIFCPTVWPRGTSLMAAAIRLVAQLWRYPSTIV